MLKSGDGALSGAEVGKNWMGKKGDPLITMASKGSGRD